MLQTSCNFVACNLVVVLCCVVLCCVVLCCVVLCCVVLCCVVLWCGVVWCGVVWCGMVWMVDVAVLMQLMAVTIVCVGCPLDISLRISLQRLDSVEIQGAVCKITSIS